MHPGRERNILRWQAQHALLSEHLARIEEALATAGEPRGQRERERLENLLREREELQRRLQQLGPSPEAMMG